MHKCCLPPKHLQGAAGGQPAAAPAHEYACRRRSLRRVQSRASPALLAETLPCGRTWTPDPLLCMPAGERDARQVGGLLLRELARGAAEAFAGQAAAALPTAFLAARDEDADVAATWAEVWEEGTSGGAGAARLYACDIVPLIVRGALPGCQALFFHAAYFANLWQCGREQQ